MMPNLFKETARNAESCLEDAKVKCESDRECYAVSVARHVRKKHWVCRAHTTSDDLQLYRGWLEPISRKSSEIGCPQNVYAQSADTWDKQQCVRKVANH